MGGRPNTQKISRAREAIDRSDYEMALKMLAGSVHGAGYDSEFFELMGLALLGCEKLEKAGCFLFLSGQRKQAYKVAINYFLTRNHNPQNFRQLHSQFPQRIKTMWKISCFPPQVYKELKEMGFPEDIQQYFIDKKMRHLPKTCEKKEFFTPIYDVKKSEIREWRIAAFIAGFIPLFLVTPLILTCSIDNVPAMNIIFLLFFLLPVFIGGIAASKFNRNTLAWTLGGFLYGIPTLILAILGPSGRLDENKKW